MPLKDYYKILEISADASQDEIKEKYRFLAHAWHPDKFPPRQKAYAEAKMKEVNEAYEVLGDPEKRKEYDKKRGSQFSTHHEQDHFREKERTAHREAEERAEVERQKKEQAEIEKQRQKQAEKERKEAEQKEISKYFSGLAFLSCFGFGLISAWLLLALGVSLVWVIVFVVLSILMALGGTQGLAEARWRAKKEQPKKVLRKWSIILAGCLVLLWGLFVVVSFIFKTRLLFFIFSMGSVIVIPVLMSTFYKVKDSDNALSVSHGLSFYLIIMSCVLIYFVAIPGFGLEKLINKASSPIVSERLTVASKLDNMLEWSSPTDPRITDILVKLSTDSDSKVRENAISALGRAGDLNRLIAALKDPVGDVRKAAANFLGEIKDPNTRQALAEIAASDPDGAVRKEARRALGRLPKK